MKSKNAQKQRDTLENDQYVLNRAFRFFSHRGRRYAFMSALPHPLCYMALSRPMEALLKRFDGRTSVEDIFPDRGSPDHLRRFIKGLYQAGVLMLPGEESLKDNALAPLIKRNASMCVLPTTDCNLRCVYCYSSAGDNPVFTVGRDAVESSLEYFFGHLSESITGVRLLFQGAGEPTHVFPVMKETWNRFKAQSKRMNLRSELRLVTNGVFNGDVLKWIIEQRAFVTFSLDGPPRIQNSHRPKIDGSGSYDIAAHNIRQLVHAGMAPKMRTSVTRNSLPAVPEIVRHAGKLGISMLQLEPCRDVGRARGSMLGEPDRDDFVKAFLESMGIGLGIGVNVHCSALVSLRPGEGRFCGAAEAIFVLTPEGHVSSCPEVSLSSDPASEVFFYGKTAQGREIVFDEDRRQRLKSREGAAIIGCNKCFVKDSCGGGCPVKAYRTTGRLNERDSYLCGIIRQINVEIIADIAEGRLGATWRWRPQVFSLGLPGEEEPVTPTARLVTLTPPYHPGYRPIPPEDRPFILPRKGTSQGTVLFIPDKMHTQAN